MQIEVSKSTARLVKLVVILLIANISLMVLYHPVKEFFSFGHYPAVILPFSLGITFAILLVYYSRRKKK